MEALAKATTVHHTSGKFINDDNLVVFDQIVFVFVKNLVRAQGLRDVMECVDILNVVKRPPFNHARIL